MTEQMVETKTAVANVAFIRNVLDDVLASLSQQNGMRYTVCEAIECTKTVMTYLTQEKIG